MNLFNDYDHVTASHYAAYRPYLHSKILDEYLEENIKYNFGLDIGCGTGHSSIALAHYCNKVIGIDPSQEMLQKSLSHSRVDYALHNSINLGFASNYFDIITLAGSLYYAKSQKLLNEIVRVGTSTGKILVYDFELIMEEIHKMLEIDCNSKQESDYDHQVNFSGLDEKNIKIEKEFSKSYSIKISLSNLTHLLLSSKDNYTFLAEMYGDDDLYNKVTQKSQSVFKSEKIIVEAMTYLTVYSIIK